MAVLPLVLFILTYLGLALGRVRGLALDRTGFAVLGAVAFLATGSISVEEAKAAVDAPTLVVLFGMMLLSAQYRLSGLYGAIAGRLARVGSPRRLLAGTILISGALSAVLTNDVVPGADLGRAPVLVPAVAALGNLVGNVPAVMLLLPFVGRAPETGWALALASTFAGNAVLVGSIANLIVAEQAERLGLSMSFRDHLRVGLPVTLVSLAIAVAAMMVW